VLFDDLLLVIIFIEIIMYEFEDQHYLIINIEIIIQQSERGLDEEHLHEQTEMCFYDMLHEQMKYEVIDCI
jgi:hypothetical protein